MNGQQPLLAELLEEYKICQQKATTLDDNIWKTAGLLGVGSVTGIVVLSSTDAIPCNIRPWLLVVISLTAIGVLATWWRLAVRWWSIEQAMFRRMEHIERCSQLRANLYVRYLNQLADKTTNWQREDIVHFTTDSAHNTLNTPFLNDALLKDLEGLKGAYKHRGIKPMMRFVIWVNVGAWIAFLLFQVAPHVPSTAKIDGPVIFKWAVVLLLLLAFVGLLGYHYFKNE